MTNRGRHLRRFLACSAALPLVAEFPAVAQTASAGAAAATKVVKTKPPKENGKKPAPLKPDRVLRARAGLTTPSWGNIRTFWGEEIAPRDTGIEVYVDFFFDKPKSTGKKVIHKTTKPDLDKLLRGILDALTGVAYVDDSQVIRSAQSKQFGSPARAEVKVVYVEQRAAQADGVFVGNCSVESTTEEVTPSNAFLHLLWLFCYPYPLVLVRSKLPRGLLVSCLRVRWRCTARVARNPASFARRPRTKQ